MQNRLTLRMCNTTGKGAAKNRAFSGVISAPPARPIRRTIPAATGTALSTINGATTNQSPLAEEFTVIVRCVNSLIFFLLA